MQFSTLFIAAFASLAVATPLTARAQVCGSGLDTPQCCSLDVDGIADLSCSSPDSIQTSIKEFKATCAKEGQEAKCCVLPVDGDALVCDDP